jgi:bacillithiol system protein YtxJ
MERIRSIEEFLSLIESEDNFYFLKHSATCPISMNAYREYESFVADEQVKGYYLVVQEDRPLSNYIADTYSIRHESPQVFLFQNGKPIWHTSHWNITKEQLQKTTR